MIILIKIRILKLSYSILVAVPFNCARCYTIHSKTWNIRPIIIRVITLWSIRTFIILHFRSWDFKKEKPVKWIKTPNCHARNNKAKAKLVIKQRHEKSNNSSYSSRKNTIISFAFYICIKLIWRDFIFLTQVFFINWRRHNDTRHLIKQNSKNYIDYRNVPDVLSECNRAYKCSNISKNAYIKSQLKNIGFDLDFHHLTPYLKNIAKKQG